MKLSIKYLRDEMRVAVTGLVNYSGDVLNVRDWIPGEEPNGIRSERFSSEGICGDSVDAGGP